MINNSRSLSKGQWFLIGTIIVSNLFLFVSLIFEQYLLTENPGILNVDEDFYFWDIYNSLNKTTQTIGFSDCNELETKLDEFIHFSEQSMSKRGYYLFVNKSINCATQEVKFGILLASHKAIIFENVDPNDIIPGINLPVTTISQ